MDILHVLLLLPIIILLVLQHKNTTKRQSKTKRVIPGPPGLPLIGNLHQFFNSAPHQYLYQLSKKYGPLISFQLGSVPAVVVSSARMAEEVMRTHDLVFCSRPPMLGPLKLSYDGIDIALSPYNEKWRELRKLCVVHLLSTKRVQSFRPIREDEVFRMMGKISRDAAEGKLTNLTETVMRFASTIVCRVAFGKRYDEEDHERKRFSNLFHEAQAAHVWFYFSDFFPKFGWLDRFTGTLPRLEKVFKELDTFYQELIDEHMDYSTRPESMDGDIIDLMLQLRQENPSSSLEITVDHIKAMIKNVFFAGTDTSAGTIVWAMTALMKNPATMQKVQAEIRTVIGNKQQKTIIIDEDDVEKLPYLKAVVKETFRLYPPAPLLVPRYTMDNCIVDGFPISSNTIVYINAWAIARDPDYWENPDEFLPERFLDGRYKDIDMKGQDFHFIPFGAGRRGCPGYFMGLMTVELTLANLLYSFNWELPSGMKRQDIDTHQVLPGITMLKKEDLQLVASKYI
ncbi:OLC1v1000186C1 [Oldenlandia corymbosa var. corymbosa]|uniref:OLC1v1000186C1 n=1 Tax=Oldenlandia corymbosa var. corymbosa TaxID=529605 RepID=A0AAV1D390_OLDCO|nr:OLC1v1000186C1 [Oldenlandia corymbosa var. corymbosa]